MPRPVPAPRGTRDLLPEDGPAWEPRRGDRVGPESSDAVEKEMYRVIGAAKAGRGSYGAPLPRHRQHARESA